MKFRFQNNILTGGTAMPKYYMPTTLLFGTDCVKRHKRHLIHGKKCMIVTGVKSAVLSGALKDVKEVLDGNGVVYEIYDKIKNYTGISEIYELAKLMCEKNIEYIVAIGGGTAIDAAKAAAVYATNDIEPMQIFEEKYENSPLTVVCVPTTAGTGSDTTQYVMMTLDDAHSKKSFGSPMCFPYATFLDSKYTETLPLTVTRNTAVDALCHSVESYLNLKASPFSDNVALEGIRLVGQCARALVTGEITKEVREKLLVAASLGGMAVAHTGLNVVHAMGYQLTCDRNVPHGCANGSLLAEFIAWSAKADVMRAVEVMDAFGTDLSAFKKFMDTVVSVDREFKEEDIELWLENSIIDTVKDNCPRMITREDERQIYINALLNKDRKYTEW